MNKKFKALLSCLALTATVGALASCDISSFLPGSSTMSESESQVEVESTPVESTSDEGMGDLLKNERTATFVADGETVRVIVYKTDATSIVEPKVPEKAGYAGAWEAYTLGENIVVNAVYTAIEYTATFVADGEIVAEVTYTVENAPAIPEVPAKDHYTGAWDAYELNGDITVNAVYTAIEYTVTFKVDGQVFATETYTVEDKEITVPEIPAKEGYGANWEEYELNGGDVEVNAVYKLGIYTVSFVAEGKVIYTEEYSMEDKEITEPEVPAKEHYTGAWAAYELTTGDVTVNAVYTAIEYTVTFMKDNETVATETYTIENKEITVPEVPAKEHYTNGAWAAYELNGGDVVVNATYVPVEYVVNFICDGENIGSTTYTIENMSIEGVAIPEKTGYTGKLAEYDLTVLTDLDIEVIYTPNTYKITYNAAGGEATVTEQEVVYDAEYTLATATPYNSYMEFLGWADEKGNMVTEGIWNVAKDVTLTAVYSEVMTFENATDVPSALSGSRTEYIALTNLNGNNVIEVKAEATNEANVGVHMSVDFLGEFFKDPSVDYFAFDIMLDPTATTVMHQIYFQDYRSGSAAWKNYESTACDKAFNYIPTETFKTLYLPRDVYESYITTGQTAPRFLLVGAGVMNGQYFYIDNFRSVTAEEKLQDWWSFEYGGLRTNNGNSPLFYTPDNSQWELNFSNIDSTTFKFTHELTTHGNRALTFTKKAGDTKISLNHTTDTEGEKQLRAAGYMSFDLYVPEGSDAALYNNSGKVFETLKQGWNTIYAKVPEKGAEKENELVKFWDSTASTYVIDNIRVLTKDQFDYEGDMLGFEGNSVIMRNETETAEKSVAYLYSMRDALAERWTFVASATEANTKMTNFGYSTEVVKEGKQSLTFHKTNGYIYFALNTGGEMYKLLKNGFTFWLYVELDEHPMINVTGTSNFVSGTNAKFASFNENIKSGTWVQVTVNADEINSTGRFLIIQGSTAGTYYIDGIQPLSAE